MVNCHMRGPKICQRSRFRNFEVLKFRSNVRGEKNQFSIWYSDFWTKFSDNMKKTEDLNNIKKWLLRVIVIRKMISCAIPHYLRINICDDLKVKRPHPNSLISLLGLNPRAKPWDRSILFIFFIKILLMFLKMIKVFYLQLTILFRKKIF